MSLYFCDFCSGPECVCFKSKVEEIPVAELLSLVPDKEVYIMERPNVPLDTNELINKYTAACVEIQRLLDKLDRTERLAEEKKLDSVARDRTRETELENLRLNQAPCLAEQLKARDSEIAALKNVYREACNSANSRIDSLVNRSGILENNIKTANVEMSELRNKIAILKGERPSLFSRAINKLTQPFVVGTSFVGTFFSGLKISLFFILSVAWFAIKVTCWHLPTNVLMGIFALPTIERKLWGGWNEPMAHGAVSIRNLLSFMFGNGALVIVLFYGLLGHLTPSTWLPSMLQSAGSYLFPYLNWNQKFWLASNLMNIVHAIYFFLAGTNLVSLFYEIWRANKKPVLEENKEKDAGKLSVVEVETPKTVSPLVPQYHHWKIKHDPSFDQINYKGKKFEFCKVLNPEDNNRSIFGEVLKKRMEDGQAIGERGLRHLLANPDLIPENLRGKCIVGNTIWLDGDEFRVPCLCWDGDEWHLRFLCLGNICHSNDYFVRLCA